MAKYEGKDRWQFQPRYVKIYRWWRYIFPAWFVFLYRIASWVICGAQQMDIGDDVIPRWKISRKETFGLIRRATFGMAQVRAGRYVTSDELTQNLKDRE